MSVKSGKPRVSVGVPVRNGERFLVETLDSLLGQTYTGFELIISDNASTDNTEAICREYAARDPRVRYYRSPQDVGLANNYNSLFARAEGDYF
ncbi:MAG: glycosyltransferase family 2 protein, partial [Terriglobales bacterium]